VEPVRDNLIFSLESWPEAGANFDFTLSPAALLAAMRPGPGGPGPGGPDSGEPLVFKTAMRGRLSVQLAAGRLRVKGAFAVKVELTCARCLAPFVGRVSDNIDETVKLVEAGAEADAAWEGDVVAENGRFDLAPLMAELFWLSWPHKALCKPDCAGLCPACGANLNEIACSCAQGRATRH
jgi:hypothetical protein